MDEPSQRALENDRTIDITTTGRNSGQPRRIEIWRYRYDGRTFLSGSPGTRDWYANLLANPEFTFHLKRSAQADLPAPVGEEVEALPVVGPLPRLGVVHARSPGRGSHDVLDHAGGRRLHIASPARGAGACSVT